jgi:pimeloyl-ACP methyl ester carboxylesterase
VSGNKGQRQGNDTFHGRGSFQGREHYQSHKGVKRLLSPLTEFASGVRPTLRCDPPHRFASPDHDIQLQPNGSLLKLAGAAAVPGLALLPWSQRCACNGRRRRSVAAGAPQSKQASNQPNHPLDLAGKIKAPILGLYGGADTGIPVSTIEQMKAALGPDTASTFQVYPEAPHAFFADYRPSYREAAAKDGWQRLTSWLKTNGVA